MQPCTSWCFGWFHAVQQLIIFGSEQRWVITEMLRNAGTHGLCEHHPHSGSESGTLTGQGLSHLPSSSSGELSRCSCGAHPPSSVILLDFWALFGGRYISKERKKLEVEEIVISCYNPEPTDGRNKTEFFSLGFTFIASDIHVLCRWSDWSSASCPSPLLEKFSLKISRTYSL